MKKTSDTDGYGRHIKRRGSALTMAIFVTVILSLLMGSYLRLANSEVKMAQRSYLKQACVGYTEAVAENAIFMLLNGHDGNWTVYDADVDGDIDMAYRQFTNIGYPIGGGNYSLLKGIDGEGYVVLDSIETSPTMRVEGRISDVFGNVSIMQMQMQLKRRSLFANAMTAKDTITFAGGVASVDSYDSSVGPYNPANPNDNGGVGSISVTTDAVSTSNSDIYGYVATGGAAPNIGPTGKVWGKDTPPGVTVDPNRISTDFFTSFEDIDDPTLSSPLTQIGTPAEYGTGSAGSPGWATGSGGPPAGGGPPGGGPSPTTYPIGDATGASITYYQLSALDVKNADTALEIVGPCVFVMDGDIDIKGEVQITGNGSLEIYTAHDLTVGGNGILNLTADPSKLLIYGTATNDGDQTFTLHGNGALSSAVYAPHANVDLRGGGHSGEMFGSVVAYQIFMNGTYSFHYDENLANLAGPDASWQIANWFEITASSDLLDFDTIHANMDAAYLSAISF